MHDFNVDSRTSLIRFDWPSRECQLPPTYVQLVAEQRIGSAVISHMDQVTRTSKYYTRDFELDSTCCGAVRCGAVRCGAVRCGAVRCGAVRCGAVRCGAVRCGAVRCGAVRCGAVRCGAVRCGAVRSGPVRSGPVRSGPVRSGPVRSGPVRSGPVRSGPVRSGPGLQCLAILFLWFAVAAYVCVFVNTLPTWHMAPMRLVLSSCCVLFRRSGLFSRNALFGLTNSGQKRQKANHKNHDIYVGDVYVTFTVFMTLFTSIFTRSARASRTVYDIQGNTHIIN